MNKHSFFTDKLPQARRSNLGEVLTKIPFRAIIMIEKVLGGFSVMRKIKMAIVSMLVVFTVLFCLVGCGQTGKYVATAYKAGSLTLDLTDSTSYVELKGGDEAVVSIDLVVGKLEGTGTWAKGEEKNTVVVTVEGIEYTATVEDGKMTMNIFGTSLIFTKE